MSILVSLSGSSSKDHINVGDTVFPNKLAFQVFVLNHTRKVTFQERTSIQTDYVVYPDADDGPSKSRSPKEDSRTQVLSASQFLRVMGIRAPEASKVQKKKKSRSRSRERTTRKR